MNRKDFLGTAALFTATGASLSLLDSCTKDNSGPNVDFTIDISQSPYTMLNNIGGVARKDGVIIIRDNLNAIIALSEACTHEGCSINYDSNSQTFPCPCHGAKFDLSGSVINGPAKTALKKYTATLTGSSLRVNG